MFLKYRSSVNVELQTTSAALALAWVARNPNTSMVILGASLPDQVLEILKALEVLPRLTENIMSKIDVSLDDNLCWWVLNGTLYSDVVLTCGMIACVRTSASG